MRTPIICLAMLATAGCVSGREDIDETFGAAFAENAKAQIVDPTPAEGAPTGDGTAADLATFRYKTDKIKEGATGEFEAGEEAEEEGGP